jgi:hypothetical protein
MPTAPSTRLGFQIINDGSALRDGLMSSNDLAPALGLLNMIQEESYFQ